MKSGLLPPSNTLIVGYAFHVFDITKYMGRLIASGGTVAPAGSKSRYPGGVFVATDDGMLWPRFFPGQNSASGVVRATFMHRFRERLYVGFQNNERRMKWDLGVIDGDPVLSDTRLTLGRVTKRGGWKTHRFASDESSNLYWIASNHRARGASAFFHSRDGLRFSRQEPNAGDPQDAIAGGGRVLLLTDRGLYRWQKGVTTQLLAAPDGAPFDRRDSFCSAPMTATPHGLVAGSTNGLGLFLAAP